tara:strand:- start:6470 stop:7309 length:840 start_codon:yes stop_codon:yes gene_type:complete
MNEAISYSAAFMIGLIGSPHCVGMCGGIAGLLASSTAPSAAAVQSTASATVEYIPIAERRDPAQLQNQLYQILLISLFQLGRISCYALLGALAGGLVGGLITASSFAIEDLANITKGLRILASLMLVMVALSIAGWTQLTRFLESAGGGVWKRIQPLTKRLIPVNSPRKALAIGGLWGFLPCGLIYSALAWSALSGSAIQSGVLMFCFGLGTVPAVMGVSGLTGSLRLLMKKPLARRGFAILLIALAITPWLAMGEKSHAQHTGHSSTSNQQEHLMHME